MSSPDENTPETDTTPLLDAARRPARRPAERPGERPGERPAGRPGVAGRTPAEHKTAGQAALEQALSQSGKHLEDLTGETTPDRPRG
ncbi:hypothetical protein ACFYUV_24910 [Nonomuraea sp. NPDC003560]|uniref:hypothetical protein n=1 Tax=Nonomuraea sp. NPDC003560 TaxID=3364341 RepID=UPI0036AB8147